MGRRKLRKTAQLAAWSLLGLLALVALLGAPPWPSGSAVPEELLAHPFWNYNPELEEPRDPRQGCSLPRVHPFHPVVWPHLKATVPLVCKIRQPWLTYVDVWGNLRFNGTSGYDLGSLRCFYRPIRRVTDDVVDYGDPVPFSQDPTPLTDDVVLVTCRNFIEFPVYTNIHAVVRPPPKHDKKQSTSRDSQDGKGTKSHEGLQEDHQKSNGFIQRGSGQELQGLPDRKGQLDGSRRQIGQRLELGANDKKKHTKGLHKGGLPEGEQESFQALPRQFERVPGNGKKVLPNVLIFGLDSVSRLSMMRLLPKTYEFLARKLGAIVFRGMNKVGDNTYPNLVALLTGLEAYRQVPHPGPTGDTFDGTPLVWKDFHEAGYRTLFAEDFPRFGLFNYLARGFERPPTDLYLRPFWLAVEDSFLLRSSSSLCFGNVVKHQLQMEYLRRFLVQSRNMSLPYFAFSFLVEISHEYMQQVAAADDDFVSFLSELLTDGHLDNTFLFFFSDHGHRFDSIRETFVGRIEERLPFFALRPPSKSDWLDPDVDLDPIKSFQSNSGRLTSPYDTYETLRDILSLGRNGSQTDKRISDFGISLFRTIPANRTCEQAGVPSQYCSCDSETPLDLSDPVVAKSALALVEKVNQLLVDGLGEHSQRCARLHMHRIHDARELTASQAPPSAKSGPNMDVASSSSAANIAATTAIDTASLANATSGVRRLRVTVEVDPSAAMFDGTLLVYGDMDIRVLEDISRINRYGNQSACIEHEILRKYCYCALTT